MSHLMTALAMRQTGLKPAAKIVLYWLADHHNSETGLCCPSLTTLSKETEMVKQSVVKWLDELEKLGIIERRTRERPNGSQTSTEYVLTLEGSHKNRLSNKLTGLSNKLTGGLSNNCTPITLEDTNLGIEQEAGSDEPRLFSDLETQEEVKTDLVGEGFQTFWNDIWPKHQRKTAKADCEKVYRAACDGKHPKADAIAPTELNRCTQAYVRSVDDQQYLKAPLAWLRVPGWEPFIGQSPAARRQVSSPSFMARVR